MKPLGAPDDPRRRVWFRTLAVGLVSAAGDATARAFPDTALGQFSVGQSIQRLSGRVLVNGRQATLATPINSGDTVETADDAEVVFIFAAETFILRNGSRTVVGAPRSPLKDMLRAVAAQSGDTNKQCSVVAGTATAGIRN